MTFIKAFFAAFSTYSIIPVPQFEWDEDVTRHAICFFPFVGVLCGGAVWVWCTAAKAAGIGSVFSAAAAVSIPLLLPGGIHLDGFMDTVDAISSHQSRERRLEIMKDPNCGAFAVIYCFIYLLMEFGIYHELFNLGTAVLACHLFVLSRSLSAFCVLTLPNARKNGMLSAFTENANSLAAVLWLVALFTSCALLFIAYSPKAGGLAVVLMLLIMFLYRKMTLSLFGGTTGDTAGFLLCVSELAGLFGLWLGAKFL